MLRYYRIFSAVLIAYFIAQITAVAQQTIISGTVNSYAKVISIDYCGRIVAVESATGFAAGDKALIIQMKGASFDSVSTDSSRFGQATDYGTSGNFEFVNVESVSGTNIRIREIPVRNYNPSGAVQIVKIPGYITAIVKDVLTCPPWNGSTGGVLAVEASGAIDMGNGVIDVSAKGFRGGRSNVIITAQPGIQDYNASFESGLAGEKGESAVEYSLERRAGRGAIANGGGGGNASNGGGGGGGNGGNGGGGGGIYRKTNATAFGGIGGHSLVSAGEMPRTFMGGGGGGGHKNNGENSVGATGGGIAILKTNVFVGRGAPIYADGAAAAAATSGGGGGAGGTVIIDAGVFASYPITFARGGTGGNSVATEHYGAGGGGGGGIVCYSITAIDDSIHAEVSGGYAGISIAAGDSLLNAKAGYSGILHRGCIAPSNPIAGLSAVAVTDTSVCNGAAVRLDVTPHGGRPPYSYRWEPAAIIANPNMKATTSVPSQETEYFVTITDSLGCQASAKFIARIFDAPKVYAGQDVAVCGGGSATLRGGGEGRFRWSPATGLSDVNSPTTTASPTQTTTYALTLTDDNGCSATDSVTVTVNEHPKVTLPDKASVCIGGSTTITATVAGGKAPYSYSWLPNVGSGAAVTVSPAGATHYEVTVRDANGCEGSANITVTISPPPAANAGIDQTICGGDTTRLYGKGGVRRYWSPAEGLGSTTADEPLAFPTKTTSYVLTVESVEGCINTDTVTITVLPTPQKPTITVSEDTLICSPAQSYQWLYYGVTLPGAISRTYWAQQAGKYSVRVSYGNQCNAVSDPIDVTIGQATLCMDTFEGDPGKDITMELRLCNSQSVIESGAKEIETALLFNASLLLPLDDFYLENITKNGLRILRFRAPINLQNTDVLASLRFRIGLGDDTVTTLRLTDFHSIGGKLHLSAKSGTFYLRGVCLEGGARLWRQGYATSLLAVSPQPAEDVVRIDFTLAEKSPVQLTLSDYLGRNVFTEYLPAQENGLNYTTLNLRNIPRGLYQLRMTASAESAIIPLLLQ